MLDVHSNNDATVLCVLFVKDIEKPPVNSRSEAHSYPIFYIKATSGEIFPKWVSQLQEPPQTAPYSQKLEQTGI